MRIIETASRTMKGPLYNTGTIKVIVFASIVIVCSMMMVGMIVYGFTKDEVVNKLKTKDLVHLARSISVQIDARIERAKETAVIFSRNPEVIRWMKGGESDQEAGVDVSNQLKNLASRYDYSNSFLVSAETGHYWSESGVVIGTMSRSEPNDKWFYETLTSRNPVSVVVDYNKERNDTFVFINSLVEDTNQPIGVAGVGLSLKSLSDDFAALKYGDGSRLWLTDKSGSVFLSDHYEDNGGRIHELLPESIANQSVEDSAVQVRVLEYKLSDGSMIDLISYPLQSTNLRLLFQIPRKETILFLRKIWINTGLTVLISVAAILFFFFYVSRKLANPYKHMLNLNRELEKKVEERTQELTDRNGKLLDSIAYAQRIQEAVLPHDRQWEGLFEEYFRIWIPRDLVGGDFFWISPTGDGYLVAVGDCSGHGVPGAFMTMLAVTALNQLAENSPNDDPAFLLAELNRKLKETLHQEQREGASDDGLDLGICKITPDTLTFAGARISLYVQEADSAKLVEGDRKSIGFRKTPPDHVYTAHVFSLQNERRVFYMASDGLFDQSGGPKGHSFGKRRFLQFIEQYGELPLADQKNRLLQELAGYRREEPQLDDIAVLGFRPKA